MNDGDWYTVSWEDQIEAADYVGKAISTFQGKLDEINTETNTLVENWKDSASQAAYRARQEQWTKAATDIMGVLGQFKASLLTAAQISRDTEFANEKTMAGR